MSAVVLSLRIGGWLLLALGLGQSVLAYLSDEAANAAGVVPRVAIGFGLISVGAYALMAAGFVRERRYGWVALPATLTILAVWSITMLVSETVAVGSIAMGGRGLVGLVGLVVFAGYVVVIGTVAFLFGLLPVMYALAWIADQIPPLRRRGVGDAFRKTVVKPRIGQDDDARTSRS